MAEPGDGSGAGSPGPPQRGQLSRELPLLYLSLLWIGSVVGLGQLLVGGAGGSWWLANLVLLIHVVLLGPLLFWFALVPRLGYRVQRGTAWVLGLLILSSVLGLIPRTEGFRGRAYRGRWLQGASLEVARSLLGECRLRHELWYDLGPSPSPAGASPRHDAVLQIRCGEDGAVNGAQAWRHDGGALRSRDVQGVPFDAAAWRRAAPEDRQAMVPDLLGSGRLIGLERAALEALLGPPETARTFLREVETDSWESDAHRFPVDAEGRIDHGLW